MTVESVGASNDYSMPNKTRIPKKELDRDDFLNLMVKQLQNQNPMEPQSNEDFISTMAQFNSLQSLAALDKNAQYNQAMDLIGKVVAVRQFNKDILEGIVQSAGIAEDKVVVYLEGKSFSVADVISVKAQDSPSSVESGQQLLQAAGMIGKEVSILDDSQIANGTVEKVGLENGSLKIYIGGIAYDIAQITEIK